MATYAIGDVQGCHRTLLELLDRISFHPGRDRLWLTGDLVNRGPRSLDVLRWAVDHDRDLVSVLGNHDLHLLGVAWGVVPPRKRDTLAEVLAAPDRERLLEWLRGRPFLYRDLGYALAHAGMLPGWTVEEAEALGGEGAAALRGPRARDLLTSVLRPSGPRGSGPRGSDLDFAPGNPDQDASPNGRPGAKSRSDPLGRDPLGRVARALVAMTRLRLCRSDGSPDDGFNGSPDSAPAGSLPWFAFPGRRSQASPIIFGHWAALGLMVTPTLLALDTGCVWGGSLTAVRLEDRATFQVPSRDGAVEPAPARSTRRMR
jgi:bis(5'-nucleosyl)-tetraphosphatase (symmetrical)